MSDKDNKIVIDKAEANKAFANFSQIIESYGNTDFIQERPQVESRIGDDSRSKLTELMVMRENKDRRPKEGWQQSNFLSLGGS